jgi:integrase
VLRLEWSRVDIARAACWIPGSAAKARKPIGVPLNSDALAVLRGQVGKSATWVFPSPKGDFPMARANNTAFRNARAAVGVPWLRWHDLRHAWATWHTQSGTPAMVLAELGAWSTLRMVRRYSHFSTAHLAEHAERIAKSGSRAVQNPGKSKKAARKPDSKTARKPRRC